MNRNSRSNILGRYFFISSIIFLFAVAIVYKLFSTTVIHAEDWNKKAYKDLSRIDTIMPERGDILAVDGSVLATNLRFYTVRMDYRSEKFQEKEFLEALPALCDSMAKYFPVRTAAEWDTHLRKPLGKPAKERTRAHKVIGNISYSKYQLLKTFPFFCIKNRNKNGLYDEKRMKRSNPYGDMARRSIGGVGEQANKQVHGISGLEMALDTLLYGKPGIAKKIPLTHRIVNWTDTPAVNGFDIVTTIDIKMQDIVENELNRMLDTADADWGVAILMEVATGDIKAISNLEKSPSSGKYIEGMNRAVLGYEPGSVMKPISMLIALEDGLVNDINEVISIGDRYAYAGGRAITDSHYNSALTVKGIIEESSNIGMTKIIANPNGPYHNDPSKFRERLAEIGFLDPMNTGIAGERIPVIAAKPSRVSLSRMCYGYATEIPPLYTLSIYNAIANNGRYVKPRLVKELRSENFDSILPVTYIRERICSEENAQKLKEMLLSVVWGDRGTARQFVRDSNVKIAGKTGTCYMIDEGGYNTQKKRLAFCGFFPADNPKYSCIVLTCRPRRNLLGAASSSGQVVRNIAKKMFSRGMLNNHSDYREVTNEDTKPTFYATNNRKIHKELKSSFNIPSALAPDIETNIVEGLVPTVTGLGMREAIVAIEEAGYNVTFSGSGFVKNQTPKGGTALAKGGKVNITLTEF